MKPLMAKRVKYFHVLEKVRVREGRDTQCRRPYTPGGGTSRKEQAKLISVRGDAKTKGGTVPFRDGEQATRRWENHVDLHARPQCRFPRR